MNNVEIAFIGGSGLYKIPEVKNIKWNDVAKREASLRSERSNCTGASHSRSYRPAEELLLLI